MIDKKVAGLFLEIDSELQEYQKKNYVFFYWHQ